MYQSMYTLCTTRKRERSAVVGPTRASVRRNIFVTPPPATHKLALRKRLKIRNCRDRSRTRRDLTWHLWGYRQKRCTPFILLSPPLLRSVIFAGFVHLSFPTFKRGLRYTICRKNDYWLDCAPGIFHFISKWILITLACFVKFWKNFWYKSSQYSISNTWHGLSICLYVSN